MTQPFFSIIIPTYNRGKHILQSVKSILHQTFTNWELIIIDDGSTDDTNEIINGLSNSKIRYIYQENQERSAARNHGIKLAKGNYICFLDSDDYFKETHLEQLYNRISELSFPQGVIMTGMEIVDSNGNTLKRISPLPEIKNLVGYILNNYLVVPCLLCAHRSILEKHQFIEKFTLWEDTHLWIRVLSQYPYFRLDSYSIVIVSHEESGIVQGLQRVKEYDINRYIDAVCDLFKNYNNLLPSNLNKAAKKNYIHAKYQMYLYQARLNKQYKLVFSLLKKAIKNKFSFSDLYFYMVTFFKTIFSSITKIPLP